MNNFRRRVENSSIILDPITGRGIVDGYEVVDLGLPSGLLWATCNVGATNETEYGNYYQWGSGAATFLYRNIYHRDGIDSSYTLPPSADTATQVMGEGWRMPTKDELKELINNTTQMFTTYGTKYVIFTSKNNANAQVYFPLTGWYDQYYGKRDSDNRVNIWSSTPYSGEYAYSLICYNSSSSITNDNNRNRGYLVRGVHAAV